ncbi:MAG: hypothetical protein I3274_01290 [Candidatus Moeniiplasma glomeromycotorum]|nr:hypothetical protein [Candidatus Moeniiplasma glomeromycotorum]
MSDEEKEEFGKKLVKLYKNYAPSLLNELEKKFPWHLRYYWLILILIVLSSATIGFLIGYFVEPEQEINQLNKQLNI